VRKIFFFLPRFFPLRSTGHFMKMLWTRDCFPRMCCGHDKAAVWFPMLLWCYLIMIIPPRTSWVDWQIWLKFA